MSTEAVEGQEPVVEGQDADTTVLEVNTDTSINASLDEIDDPDVLKKMVKKLRGENAKTRTEKQANAKLIEEYKAWKESQMSETEKALARAQELEQRYLEKAREAVLAKYGIDEEDDLAEFITGSEEEMEKRAAKLSTRIKTTSDEGLVPDIFKTPGGKPVKTKTIDDGAAFLEFLSEHGKLTS